jgi:benzoate membrane transport protein
MSLAPLLTGLTAAVVGFGGSVAVVLAAAAQAGATPATTASWIAGLCAAIALSSGWLSWRHRIPVVAAWSTPGAALIAATPGLTMPTAVGAFVVAAALILATSLIAPLGRLVERLPMPIAAAMLAGVLVKFVLGPFESLITAPWLIAPLIAAFLVLRVIAPTLAVILILALGGVLAATLGQVGPLPAITLATPVLVLPDFDPAIALGLGVPLYLVTMASQNLAGFAVLRASGYADVPARPILATTGFNSFWSAFLGAHTSNLAAISAAICTGSDSHPDPAQRWPAGVAYAVCYVVIAAFAPTIVLLFAALPGELVRTIAGLALAGAMTGALVTAFKGDYEPFAPGLAFAVTLSGVTLFGIGAAFWGLAAGLVVLGLDRLLRR